MINTYTKLLQGIEKIYPNTTERITSKKNKEISFGEYNKVIFQYLYRGKTKFIILLNNYKR